MPRNEDLQRFKDMKRILYFVALALVTIACNNEDSPTGDTQVNNKPFTLEGRWYVSGSTEGFITQDSVSFRYNENVLGYQEYLFERVQKGNINYSLKCKIRSVKKKIDESDMEYIERLKTGNYADEELYMSETWGNVGGGQGLYVKGKEIYTYLSDMKWDDKLYLVAKIVKCTYNQFTVASINPDFLDFAWETPPMYKYYITFTRIK